MRGDPDQRDFGNGDGSGGGGGGRGRVKALGRGYCGKLIKEGVLYKQGLRSKVWSRRSIQLTSEALVYVRSLANEACICGCPRLLLALV